MKARAPANKRSRKRPTLNEPMYTADQLERMTDYSARTFRRLFASDTIANVTKAGAGKRGVPARVARWASVVSWGRKNGVDFPEPKEQPS